MIAAADAGPALAPLVGTLGDFPADQVLRFLHDADRPGRLVIDGALPADLVLRHSTVAYHDSDIDRAGLVELLLHLRLRGDGGFTFTPDADVDVSDGWPLLALLDEVAERVDRWREISRVLPSLDVVVRLIPSSDEGPVTLPQGTWDVVVALDGTRSVRAVALHVGGDAFATLEAVHDLVRRGRAEVVVDEPS